MSRTIDFKDPDSWTDEDRAWLQQRSDHPELTDAGRTALRPAPVIPPGVVPGISPQMVRLTAFVKDKFPDRADEDPVNVVISELGGDEAEDEPDDYPEWKVAELRAETVKRGITEDRFPTGNDAKVKAPWIALLREYDETNPS